MGVTRRSAALISQQRRVQKIVQYGRQAVQRVRARELVSVHQDDPAFDPQSRDAGGRILNF